MIQLKNISKIYKTGKTDFYALKDVDLTIAEGEFVAIRGASGCGKTTLLNIIGCLDDQSQGQYLLCGQDVRKLSDEKKAVLRNSKLGFVLQDFALIDDRTALYNVMLPLLLGKCSYREIRSRALVAMERMGIANQAKKKVNQLSGGQRQRVAIARAIVTEPCILLADEPTGQLDSETGISVMEILQTLNRNGTTIILVTHDDTVASFADRAICMKDGKVLCAEGAD